TGERPRLRGLCECCVVRVVRSSGEAGRRTLMMSKRKSVAALVFGGLMLAPIPISAQWPSVREPNVPRDAKGKVRGDAPVPRTADGKPDFSGLWMHANSGPPGRGRGGQGGAPAGANAAGRQGGAPPGAPAGAPPGGGRGGVTLD